jgi:4-amino-4-deoxy-L-arabinose transferase-like glycosyltransferase
VVRLIPGFRGTSLASAQANVRLFATDRFGDQPPFWFYFQILATGMLPWTGIMIGRLVDDVARRKRDRAGSVDVLLWAWTIAIVGFFTFSRFKLDHYVFPAAPALCLLIARAWGDSRIPGSRESRAGA